MKVGDLVKLIPGKALYVIPWDTAGVIVELIPQYHSKNLYRVQWSDATNPFGFEPKEWMLRGTHWEQELETFK